MKGTGMKQTYIKWALTALVSVAFLSVLSGCATTEKYRQMVNSWHGKNVQVLVNAWGYPDSTFKAPNGNNVYVYKRMNVTSFPSYRTGGYTTVSTEGNKTVVSQTPSYESSGGTYTFKCTTWIEVNKKNKIVNTSFRGNDCVSQ